MARESRAFEVHPQGRGAGGAGRGFSGLPVCTSHLCEERILANLAAVHFGSDEMGPIWSERNRFMNTFCLVASLLSRSL